MVGLQGYRNPPVRQPIQRHNLLGKEVATSFCQLLVVPYVYFLHPKVWGHIFPPKRGRPGLDGPDVLHQSAMRAERTFAVRREGGGVSRQQRIWYELWHGESPV